MTSIRSDRIAQMDPKAGYLSHKSEIDSAVQRVLESGIFVLGPETEALERSFADYIGVRHAVGVGNGTDALQIALRACGIGSGDRVITVSHTSVATVAAIELAGALPVLLDVEPTTYTIDPEKIEDALKTMNPRPRAIVPVHLYGHPANMEALDCIAKRYDVLVIEDCAQAVGASLEGRRTGTWGHLAAFSFYPTKNLGAIGDGGMVTTGDSRLADRVRSLRQYGWQQKCRVSKTPGLNSRLDELQSAILGVKLRYLDSENRRRRSIASAYDLLLSNTALDLPASAPHLLHAYHQYVVRSCARNALQSQLLEQGIETGIHYPLPVHLQPAYRGRLPCAGCLDVTEAISAQVLSLPMYPQLGDTELLRVASAISAFFESQDRS
jgi:dTDP-4-amino-4,6-dideoxygalactose transaminase